ncbi:MAG: hypothetical protein Q9178_005751 [Gyalolechia marmorata]
MTLPLRLSPDIPILRLGHASDCGSQDVNTEEAYDGNELTGRNTEVILNTAEEFKSSISTTRSLLYPLPLELRRRIYGYVIGPAEDNCLFLLPSKKLIAVRETSAQTQWVIIATWPEYSSRSQSWTFFHPQRTAILRTCRQAYNEAAEMLYQRNTFIIKHQLVLQYFVERLSPQQFNNIHHMKLVLYSFPGPWFSSHAPAYYRRREWEAFWHTIAGMESLQTLSVGLNYRDERKPDGIESSHLVANPPVDCCQRNLKPLLAIRGLRKFTLQFQLYHPCAIVQPNDIPATAETNALIERIREGALQPRIERGVHEINSGIYDDRTITADGFNERHVSLRDSHRTEGNKISAVGASQGRKDLSIVIK